MNVGILANLVLGAILFAGGLLNRRRIGASTLMAGIPVSFAGYTFLRATGGPWGYIFLGLWAILILTAIFRYGGWFAKFAPTEVSLIVITVAAIGSSLFWPDGSSVLHKATAVFVAVTTTALIVTSAVRAVRLIRTSSRRTASRD